MRRSLFFVILLLVTSPIMSLNLFAGSPDARSFSDFPIARIDHIPITISNNSDLQSQVSSEGWAGSGTSSDPYIITSYKIIGNGDHCISVTEIDLYLVIQDCNLA